MSWVKRILGLPRAGHSGTLDPQVTGILPVMLGNATKIANVLLKSVKEYIGVMRLHQKQSEEKIRSVSKEFVGTIYQRPPLRSSVKRRLRTRRIFYLDLLEIDEQNVLFRVGAQAGTYIRKLCVSPSSLIFLKNGGVQQISEFARLSVPADNESSINRNKLETLSLDTQTHQFINSTITSVQKLPAPPEMIRITLDSGISIEITPDHELLVDEYQGFTWKEAQKMAKGDYLVAPRRMDVNPNSDLYFVDLLDSNVLCLGSELKEKCKSQLEKNFGSVTKGCKILNFDRRTLFKATSGIRIKYLQRICKHTNLDWGSIRKLINCFKGERGAKYSVATKKITKDFMYILGLIASDGSVVQDKGCQRPNRVIFANQEENVVKSFTTIIRDHFPDSKLDIWKNQTGLFRIQVDNPILASTVAALGVTSPKETMQLEKIASLPSQFISNFLAGYFDGDGSVSLQSGTHYTQVAYDTKHFHIARTIFLLLKRLGIRSKIFRLISPTFDRKEMITKHRITISTPYDKKLFAECINCRHQTKKSRLKQLKKRFKRYESYGALDIIPQHSVKIIKNLMNRYGISKNSVYRGGAFQRVLNGGRPTRRLLSKCIKNLSNLVTLNDPEFIELTQISRAQYYLIKIKNIERIRPDFEYVYDLSVNPNHNFILEGAIVVSNCHDIGEALGPGAHMAELRRTRTGPFREDETLATLQDLTDAYFFWKEDGEENLLRQYLRPLEVGITHLPQIVIRDTAVAALAHGANLAVAGVLKLHADIEKGDLVGLMTMKGELVAIATALQSSDKILKAQSGIIADVNRVVIPADIYPPAWRRKK